MAAVLANIHAMFFKHARPHIVRPQVVVRPALSTPTLEFSGAVFEKTPRHLCEQIVFDAHQKFDRKTSDCGLIALTESPTEAERFDLVPMKLAVRT